MLSSIAASSLCMLLFAQILSSISLGTRIVLRCTTHYATDILDNYYMTTLHYTIPPTLSTGQYNLTVETDYINHVFEFDRENNNLRWKMITITEQHPDLTVASSVNLFTSVEGNRLAVNYSVLNNGNGATFTSTWKDIIVITSLQNGSAIQLQSNIHSGTLLPGESYTNQLDVNLYRGIIGNYVLRIETDIDQRITEENENNNIFISHLSMPVVYADLFAFNVTADLGQSIFAGSVLEITWFVRNIGNGLTQRFWNDAVYIDSFSSLSPNGIHLSTVSKARLLMPEEEYQQMQNVTIPITLCGDYYVFVRLDEDMQVFENANILNNIINFPLLVVSPSSPDLVVSSISYSQKLTESDERVLTVSWTVTNIGNTMEHQSSWRDDVYLSTLATFIANETIAIGYSNVINHTLTSNQQYSTSITAVLNTDVTGHQYVFVLTDSSKELIELNGEYNNFKRSPDTIALIPPPIPRLRVTIDSSHYPASLTSGSTLTVTYNVTNIGERSVSLSSWTDRIYLSPQSGIDRETILETGLYLGEVINNQHLDIGQAYSVSTELSLPYGINQFLYVIVVVDINENLGEPAMIGDMQFLHDVSSLSFLVKNGPLPDLTVSPLITSTSYLSGEPTTLHFCVTNVGENTVSGLWYDTIYLSRNNVLDGLDKRLITVPNNKSLAMQASYNHSIDVFIPFDLPSSEYYLLFETDVGDGQVEMNENNNIASVVVNIQATVSTDIVLDGVSASPTNLQYGQGV